MKKALAMAALIVAINSSAQVHPFFGGGVGYLNNPAATMKAGVQAGRFNIEASVAFSQVVPFQNSLKVGYSFGENWYVIPYAGVAYYAYASHNKSDNYAKPAVGLEAGKHINLSGTNGEFLIEGFDLFAEVFGKYIGAGFKVIL